MTSIRIVHQRRNQLEVWKLLRLSVLKGWEGLGGETTGCMTRELGNTLVNPHRRSHTLWSKTPKDNLELITTAPPFRGLENKEPSTAWLHGATSKWPPQAIPSSFTLMPYSLAGKMKLFGSQSSIQHTQQSSGCIDSST